MKLANRIIVGVVTVTLIAGFAANGFTQSAVSANKPGTILQIGNKQKYGLNKLSLLDPERFTMRNQYMMSFSSTGGSGQMMGMYMNSMEYRFNIPVIMRLKVAYQSQTGQLFGSSNAYSGLRNQNAGRVFIPSFDLVYKPWKNTTIGFYYRDYSSGYGSQGYNRYNGYDLYDGFFGYNNRYGRHQHSPFAGY
ncbi:MAG: hypothetical protein HOC71_06855 [Candidatus Latescibacteria bacterium]|nr:hypothetical protein [Candidatus Latescibacterota bacterium]